MADAIDIVTVAEVKSERAEIIAPAEPDVPSPSLWLASLVADETYYQLKSSLLPVRGTPPALPDVHLTNRLLLQLRALQIEGNKTYDNVFTWFDTLFPDVSYPSNRLTSVFYRLVKKTEYLQKDGADLTSFLQEKIDFDFVSSALLKRGLKRGQLLNEVTWTPEPTNEPLTHQVVVDLEKFRSREKLAEKFTIQWIRTLSHSTDSHQLLRKSLKKVMEHYRPSLKLKGVKREMLPVFLSAPFHTVQQQPAVQLHSCTPSASDEMKKTLKILTKRNAALLQENLDLKEQNTIFTSAIIDLSRDKKQLQLQIQLHEAIRLAKYRRISGRSSS